MLVATIFEHICNKLGLSWGSTRLRQLAWSYPTKLNIVFITVFNIGLNINLHIRFNIGFNIGAQNCFGSKKFWTQNFSLLDLVG